MLSARRLRVAGLIVAVMLAPKAYADIYRYVDKDGVWHFTNVKTDNRYQLFIRDARKKTSAGKYRDYAHLIARAAEQYKVEHALIRALIRTESNFDPRAVSRVGAQGLMQLMPETADHMEVEDSFDPEDNIFGGTRYFSGLLKRFDNDKTLAIAAYNAGPGAVEKHNGIPPIPETRRFVKKVLGFYQQYNAEQ